MMNSSQIYEMKPTKLIVKLTAKFKKDYKLMVKRGYQIQSLEAIIKTLAMGRTLPESCKDHELNGRWKGHRECHIQPLVINLSNRIQYISFNSHTNRNT